MCERWHRRLKLTSPCLSLSAAPPWTPRTWDSRSWWCSCSTETSPPSPPPRPPRRLGSSRRSSQGSSCRCHNRGRRTTLCNTLTYFTWSVQRTKHFTNTCCGSCPSGVFNIHTPQELLVRNSLTSTVVFLHPYMSYTRSVCLVFYCISFIFTLCNFVIVKSQLKHFWLISLTYTLYNIYTTVQQFGVT